MQTDRNAAVVRAGGWAALAVAACGLLRLLGAARTYAALADPSRGPLASGWTAALGAIGVASAVAQVVAVEGLRRRLGPDTRLLWTASAAGWTGAAFTLLVAAVIVVRSALPGGSALTTGLLVGWLAAFGTALWVAGVCAADWRLLRMPASLRVVGTAYAVLSLTAAVLSEASALALPFALAWWIGLGVVLLRAPRSARSSTSS